MNYVRSPVAIAAAAMVVLPFVLLVGGLTLTSATDVVIFAAACMALNILVGHTGLVSFGHAAFYGIGAYTLGLMTPKYEAASFWLTLPAAMLAAGIAAFAVGVFVVRVKGVYFIMVTLAFAQMFYFLFHDTKFGRGSDGISMNFKPIASIGGFTPFDLANATHVYYCVLVLLVGVFAFLSMVLRSPFGARPGNQGNEHALAGVRRTATSSRALRGSALAGPPLPVCAPVRIREPGAPVVSSTGNGLLMLILAAWGAPGASSVPSAFVALTRYSSPSRATAALLGGAIIRS